MTESDRKKVHKTDEDENDKGLKDLEAKHIKNKWQDAFFSEILYNQRRKTISYEMNSTSEHW